MANRKDFLARTDVNELIGALHALAVKEEVMYVFAFVDERGKSVCSSTDNKLAIAGVCADVASQEIAVLAREGQN